MRLIDADEFIKKFRNGKADTEEEKIMNRTVRRMIREQPTAYDIDKVVEALEEQKAIHEKLEAEASNECQFQRYDGRQTMFAEKMSYEKAVEVLDHAIEIVKKGGV